MNRALSVAALALVAVAQPLAAQPAPDPAAAPAEVAAPAAADATPAPPQPAAASNLPPNAPGMAEGRSELLRDRRFTERDPRIQAELVQRAELLRTRREEIARLQSERDAREIAARRARPGYGLARFSVAASVDSMFHDDAGFDFFDEDDVSTRLGLWAGYDLVRLSPRAIFGVELGAGGESLEQTLWDGDIETQLDTTTLSAGVSLRYAWLSWLDPQLRAAGGVSLLTFELEAGGQAYEQHVTSPFGTIGAGVFLHTPSLMFEGTRGEFATFGIGLLIEGGYAVRGPVELALERDSEAHAIPLRRASLGELALSGPYVRSSIVARF